MASQRSAMAISSPDEEDIVIDNVMVDEVMEWYNIVFFFCLNSHLMGITDGAMHKYFDTSTHMLKSKSQETHHVCFSCINTFYSAAVYSPPKRSMVSNQFKSLLCEALHLRIHSNCALVSMACRFNSNINKVLTNYYSFTSINTNSVKCTWQLRLLINCIGTKHCGEHLCNYCYRGYQHDQCPTPNKFGVEHGQNREKKKNDR